MGFFFNLLYFYIFLPVVFLQEKGGKVQTNKEITKRELAYPIHKEKLAYLADCSFSLPLSELPALKKFLRNTNDIMRSLLINTKPTVIKTTSHKPNPQNKEKKENEESVDEKLDRILES